MIILRIRPLSLEADFSTPVWSETHNYAPFNQPDSSQSGIYVCVREAYTTVWCQRYKMIANEVTMTVNVLTDRNG